jgi:hypothetical protein
MLNPKTKLNYLKPPSPVSFSHCEARGEQYHEPKHIQRLQGIIKGGEFLCLHVKNTRILHLLEM